MKKSFLLSILIFSVLHSFAQTIIYRDPKIEKMVSEVSKDSLESYIKKLVSFGTRNTLSTQTDTKRGIGAARYWVLKRFNEFAKQSNGRLTAFIDTVTLQPDGRRVDAPLTLGNVVATLKGVDPNDDRIFIISGHLDNMRSSPTDSIGDAPGANDDGSGTAAVIECARVMSKHSFPATIIFIAVSGEEQGLLGSQAYVKEHFGSYEDPKPGYEKFGGYYNNYSGTGRERGASEFGPPEAANIMSEIIGPFKDDGQVGAVATRSRWLGVSYNTSFNNAGLPGICMGQDPIE